MSIPEDYVIGLVEKIDLLALVQTSVEMKKSGHNWFGLCPFHQERSPSFSVVPSKNFYHCFGCGAQGDAIDWAQKIQGMQFRDAVYEFSRRMGMKVPEDNNKSDFEKARSREEFKLGQSIATLNLAVAKIYHERLRTDKIGADYARARSLSGEAAKHFMLGYAPDEWRYLAGQMKDYASLVMQRADLVVPRENATHGDAHEQKFYDRFRGRLMFPIRSMRGEVVGFGARTVNFGTPKYLNTSETPAFVKGRELYGLFEARQTLMEKNLCIVVEGYMDVVAMWMHDIKNAVATLGTACTRDQVQKLFRFTDTVVFCFDADAAGDKAAVRAMETAMEFVNDQRTARFVTLPEGEDPDTFLQAHGRAAFDEMVDKAKPLSRMAVDVSLNECDMAIPEGRAKMLGRAYELWKKLPTSAFKLQMIEEFARAGQIDRNILAAEWQKLAREAEETKDFKREQDSGNQGPHGKPIAAPGTPGGAGQTRQGWVKEGGRFRPLKPWEVGARATASQAVAEMQGGGGNGRCSRNALLVSFALKHMDWLGLITNEEMESLCALPGEVGQTLGWLDAMMQEEGVKDWETLKAGLGVSPFGMRALAMVEEFESDAMLAGVLSDTARSKEMFQRTVYQVKGEWLEARISAAMKANPVEFPEAKEELASLLRSKQAHRVAGSQKRRA